MSSTGKKISNEEHQRLQYLINSRYEQEYGASASSLSAHWLDIDEAYGGTEALLVPGFAAIVNGMAKGLKFSLASKFSSCTGTDQVQGME